MTTLATFPSNLIGLEWNVMKTQMNSSRNLMARNGLSYRAQNWSYGKYTWQLSYSILRQNRGGFTELQTLLGFCLAQAGQYTPFYYSDPTDNTVTGQAIGIGNGTQTIFPLVRAFGGFVEPNLVLNTLNNVYLNGTAQVSGFTAYQNGQYGLDSIQFSSAPGSGVVVTADFGYYFPVCFTDDSFEFNNIYYQIWEVKKMSFISVK